MDHTDHQGTKMMNNQGQSTQVITDLNWKTSQNERMTKKIGKKANLWMLISLIITTPLRKVTEYIASTLHILRELQNRDTVPTIAQHQGLEYQMPEPEYYNFDT